MWAICKELTGKNSNRQSFICEDTLKLANEFNDYLVDVVKNISNIQNSSAFNNVIKENDSSIFLKPVSTVELIELSAHLKNRYCSGCDDVAVSIVKFSIETISVVLCYIVNNSMKYSIFPDQLKFALIKP